MDDYQFFKHLSMDDCHFGSKQKFPKEKGLVHIPHLSWPIEMVRKTH
jgi:hypothetical protein